LVVPFALGKVYRQLMGVRLIAVLPLTKTRRALSRSVSCYEWTHFCGPFRGVNVMMSTIMSIRAYQQQRLLTCIA
jgi:hypothetical protein